MRICGECSLCCYMFQADLDGDELEEDELYIKPQEHWCKFCTQPGCSIYGSQMQKDICMPFNCGWKQNENIPDELQPNRCGIVLEVLDNNPNTTKFFIDEKNFSGTDAAVIELEKYTTRKYTKIYNGE